MPLLSSSIAPVAIGPRSWRNRTARSLQRAEDLVRQSHVGQLGSATRYRSWRVATLTSKPTELELNHDGFADKENGDVDFKARPKSSGVTFNSIGRLPTPFPPPALRDQSVETTVGLACGYMRGVREVEGLLRRQAGRVTQEATRLERDRERLEKLLRTLRKATLVNKQSTKERTFRPATTETGRDGADCLLEHERKGLSGLKQELELLLRDTLTQLQALAQCSRRLVDCASQRARVTELLPQHGGPSAGGNLSLALLTMKPDPTGPYTPECEEVLDSSKSVLSQSDQVRDNNRKTMGDVIIRLKALHQSVNEGLVKKIAETLNLQQHLTLGSASTMQAINRKHRQMQCVTYSHGRVMGPVCSDDLFCRERLNRPLVQVYDRHSSFLLPEAGNLTQGQDTLRQQLQHSGQEMEQLRGARLCIVGDLHGKRAAAKVDSAVVRLRRQLVMPNSVHLG